MSTDHAATDSVLDFVWGQQARWSAVAGRLKSNITAWRSAVLVSFVLGAILTTLSSQFADGSGTQRGLAWIGAAALACAPVAQRLKVNRQSIKDWTRARSASEAIKQEAYRYMTGVSPYQDPDQSSELLNSNVLSVVDSVQDLSIHEPTSEWTFEAQPRRLTLEEYLDKRAGQQIEGYYRPTAKRLNRMASRLRRVETAVALAAASLGAVGAVVGSSLGGWVGVATTVGGAVVAHREGSRYERQSVSYSATAARLEALVATWRDRAAEGTLSESEESALVDAVEGAISIENQAWMTSWIEAPQSTM